jgi:Mg2+/Co2+ transporter CorB
MQTPVWLLVGDILLWIGIFVLHAIRFNPTTLSPFELKRRSQSGDSEALKIDERERLLPRLQTLRRVIEAVCLVVATALTILVLGWILGTAVASLLSLLVGTIARLRLVASAAAKLYEPHESRLLDMVEEWRWLDWFRSATAEGRDVTATSKAELQYIVERSASVLSRDELLRFRASLALDTHSVEDVMTPVSVLEVADVHDSLGPLVLDDLHKTGHSRFPVIEGDVHHIVGVLYLHDIINLKSAKPTVREAMDPRVHYIHEHQSLEHALHGFLRTHRHLFIVVNDYRETVGVLTLEDVLETLLGKKIVDEFDQYEDLRAVAESNPRKNNLPKGKTDI